MDVSSKIRLDLFKGILNLDDQRFNEKIIYWAKRFGFKLEGDFIIFKDADIQGFIEDLDNQFKIWEKKKK